LTRDTYKKLRIAGWILFVGYIPVGALAAWLCSALFKSDTPALWFAGSWAVLLFAISVVLGFRTCPYCRAINPYLGGLKASCRRCHRPPGESKERASLVPWGVVVLLLFLAVALGTKWISASHPKKFQPLTLPSGSVIKVQDIWKVTVFQKGTFLVLEYESHQKIADKAALRTEAAEVWSVFKTEVEKRGFKAALTIAHEGPAQGFLLQPLSYEFTYQKQPDGSWTVSEDQK
jgi:hypothetical protein